VEHFADEYQTPQKSRAGFDAAYGLLRPLLSIPETTPPHPTLPSSRFSSARLTCISAAHSTAILRVYAVSALFIMPCRHDGCNAISDNRGKAYYVRAGCVSRLCSVAPSVARTHIPLSLFDTFNSFYIRVWLPPLRQHIKLC
jgi:hypothetical protein